MMAPNNNSRNVPAAPVEGFGRLWCPACRGSLSRKTPPRCPECLQPLWIEVALEPRGHVTAKDLEQAGVKR